MQIKGDGNGSNLEHGTWGGDKVNGNEGANVIKGGLFSYSAFFGKLVHLGKKLNKISFTASYLNARMLKRGLVVPFEVDLEQTPVSKEGFGLKWEHRPGHNANTRLSTELEQIGRKNVELGAEGKTENEVGVFDYALFYYITKREM